MFQYYERLERDLVQRLKKLPKGSIKRRRIKVACITTCSIGRAARCCISTSAERSQRPSSAASRKAVCSVGSSPKPWSRFDYFPDANSKHGELVGTIFLGMP